VGPHLTQCGQGRGLRAWQVSFWSVQPFGHSAPTTQDRTDGIGRTILQTVAQNGLPVDCFWGDRLLNGLPYAAGPLSCLSICNVGVLPPNGWMDQDGTWYGGRPRPRRGSLQVGLPRVLEYYSSSKLLE